MAPGLAADPAACLSRIRAHNASLKALAYVVPEPAPSLDAEGPLGNVPFVLKDTWDVSGIPSTGGSARHRDRKPLRSSAAYELFLRQGAVFLGKSNVGDMAFSPEAANYVVGATANPYDASRTAGGSTGGGAAAVAAGLADFDWGGDFGGSIRIPAAFCGVVGMRLSNRDWPLLGEHFPPMPGRLAHMLGWGPVARTVRAAADVVRAAESLRREAAPHREFDLHDVAILPPDAATMGDWPSFVKDATGALDRANIHFSIGVPGVTAKGADRLFDRYLCARFDAFLASEFMSPAEALRRITRGILGRGDEALRIHPTTGRLLALTAAGYGMYFWDKRGTHEAVTALERALSRVWDSGRLIVSPTTTFAAPKHGGTLACRGLLAFAKLGNLVDATAVSVPFGHFEHHRGRASATRLPRGLQILGPPGSERAVLSLARRLEEIFPPGAPAGYHTPL